MALYFILTTVPAASGGALGTGRQLHDQSGKGQFSRVFSRAAKAGKLGQTQGAYVVLVPLIGVLHHMSLRKSEVPLENWVE